MARSKKTGKKPAAKQAKAKAKKPAAKKKATAAKKPAAKKPAAKKPAAKQPAAKQHAAKQPAAKKPAAEPPAAAPAEAPPPAQLAQLAMRGDLDVLFGLVFGLPESDRDALAYKWLAVASDFGHDQADDMIADLMEVSSLRYDDDQFETGNAHWELGLAYLTGTEGLPRDFEKARAQLADAKERNYPMSVQESDAMLAQARARLAPDALAVFDAVFDGSASAGVIDDRDDEGDESDGD